MRDSNIIERAYQLIGEPIDPIQKVSEDIAEIVNYRESEAGETVEYFASPAQNRGAATIISADGAGSLTYHKVELKTVTALSFSGLQSNLETVLLDEILNSKDQLALAQKKEAIITSMSNQEAANVMALIFGYAGGEVNKVTGLDFLDTLILMKEKISNFSSNYVLLCASDVYNALEKYDVDNKAVYNYRLPIKEVLASMNVVKIIKVLGIDKNAADILPAGHCALVGISNKAIEGKPITLLRRKMPKGIAEYSGCAEGAVRLIDVAKIPTIINGSGANTLGYGVFGYSSVIQVLLNPACVAWCDDILI